MVQNYNLLSSTNVVFVLVVMQGVYYSKCETSCNCVFFFKSYTDLLLIIIIFYTVTGHLNEVVFKFLLQKMLPSAIEI